MAADPTGYPEGLTQPRRTGLPSLSEAVAIVLIALATSDVRGVEAILYSDDSDPPSFQIEGFNGRIDLPPVPVPGTSPPRYQLPESYRQRVRPGVEIGLTASDTTGYILNALFGLSGRHITAFDLTTRTASDFDLPISIDDIAFFDDRLLGVATSDSGRPQDYTVYAFDLSGGFVGEVFEGTLPTGGSRFRLGASGVSRTVVVASDVGFNPAHIAVIDASEPQWSVQAIIDAPTGLSDVVLAADGKSFTAVVRDAYAAQSVFATQGSAPQVGLLRVLPQSW